MFIVFEHNKDNNLHCHALLYNSAIQTDADLNCFRKEIFSEPMTILNLNKKNKKPIDFMNNIVYVDDSVTERFKYMQKEEALWSHFKPIYYASGVREQSERVEPSAYKTSLKKHMKNIDQIQCIMDAFKF